VKAASFAELYKLLREILEAHPEIANKTLPEIKKLTSLAKQKRLRELLDGLDTPDGERTKYH
jgi:hypothetical protein